MAKPIDARTGLLNAALNVVREKGYSATTVDDLCAAAGVTKGAFFHHFKSKEDLGAAAANHWSKVTSELFSAAPYHRHADPLDRVLGYIDFRKQLLKGDVAEFTCLVGTMVQETFASHPAIRTACRASIFGHAATLDADIAEAMRQRRIRAEWTAENSRASHPGSPAGSLYPGQSEKRRRDRRRQHRSSAPLHRTLVSTRKAEKKKETIVSTNDTYLAVFLGSKTSPAMKSWLALPEAERRSKEREGMAAWKSWVEKHQSAVVGMGGPLGKTKKVTPRGIEDTSNEMGAFMVVRADSHEAAARLFEKHPHFTIFPGESVEIMPVLPIPGT